MYPEIAKLYQNIKDWIIVQPFLFVKKGFEIILMSGKSFMIIFQFEPMKCVFYWLCLNYWKIKQACEWIFNLISGIWQTLPLEANDQTFLLFHLKTDRSCTKCWEVRCKCLCNGLLQGYHWQPIINFFKKQTHSY